MPNKVGLGEALWHCRLTRKCIYSFLGPRGQQAGSKGQQNMVGPMIHQQLTGYNPNNITRTPPYIRHAPSEINYLIKIFMKRPHCFIFLFLFTGHIAKKCAREIVSYGNQEGGLYEFNLTQLPGLQSYRVGSLEITLIKRNQMLDLGLSGAQAGKRVQMLDLGLGRGFSGAQAGKHLIGLLAASAAGGPGRRRRSLELPEMHLQHQLTQSSNLSTADNAVNTPNTAK
ncbi:unnamed protein product, partial [Meganyctiphanes norvegica]